MTPGTMTGTTNGARNRVSEDVHHAHKTQRVRSPQRSHENHDPSLHLGADHWSTVVLTATGATSLKGRVSFENSLGGNFVSLLDEMKLL